MAKKPNIRFAGFEDDWEQRKVGDITKELSEYAKLNSGLPLLTSARTGLMYQSDYRGNSTTDNENTLFSIVPLNACTYRHMSDDSTFHINVNTLEKGLVSKEYPVFVENESDLRFVVQYINSSDSFTKFCTEQKKGGTRTRLYYKTLCEYKMLIPSLNEQHIIADYFDNLDHLITLHQRKCDELKKVKKFMLQKMFPKKGEKNPEIRFDGFTNDWEQRKVYEMFKVTRGYVLPATDTSEEISDEMPYPVYSSQTKDNGLMGYYSDYLYEDAITWTTDGANAGTVNFRYGRFYCTNVCGVLLSDKVEASKAVAEALNNVAKRYVSYVGNPKLMNNVMADIQIKIPTSREERAKISSYFSNLDHLITLHQRKCEELKNVKKYMLQNMFAKGE